MHIAAPIEPTTALWDGLLEPPVAMRSDAGMARSLATLELAVTAEDRLGPIHLSLPTRDASKLRWVVGDVV